MKRYTLLLVLIIVLCGATLGQTRIRFSRGRTSATVTGFLGCDTGKDYLIGARKGQKMSLLLLSRGATAYISDNNGSRFEMDESKQTMAYYFPYTGDVRITVFKACGGSTDYSLKATIR